MTNFLQLPAIAPLAHAFLDKLEQGGAISYLDFPPALGMTEDLFHAIADEIALQLETDTVSAVH